MSANWAPPNPSTVVAHHGNHRSPWRVVLAVVLGLVVLGAISGAVHGSTDNTTSRPAVSAPAAPSSQQRIESAVESSWASFSPSDRLSVAAAFVDFPGDVYRGFRDGWLRGGGTTADADAAWAYLTTVVMPRDFPYLFDVSGDETITG